MADSNLVSFNSVKSAVILDTTPSNVRAMCRSGRLKGFKTGTGSSKSQWRITKAELERFMSEGPVNE